MKRLILSDIHANLAALEAVFETEKTFDEIVFLGDLANFGPNPRECVELLMKQKVICIMGNHDAQIVSDNPKHWWDAWSKSQLSYEQLQWISSFKPQEILDHHILLLHGAYAVSYDILPNIPNRMIEQAFASYLKEGIDEVWFGHYHYQIDREINGITYRCIRPVGHQRDKDTRASYSVFEDGVLTHKRIPYDLGATLDSIRRLPCFSDESATQEFCDFFKHAYSEKLLYKDIAAMEKYAAEQDAFVP